MDWIRTSVTWCARIRARVAACARREDGELLIEVLVSAMLVALISAAILNGYSGIAHLSGDQRKRSEANALAEQDQARLRGLTITQLAATGAGTGNYTYSQVIDGTTYNITSASQYITGSSAGSSCATGPTISAADEVATSSTVNWNSGTTTNDNRNPVVIHGLVTPSEGGSLVVTATTGSTGASGLAGVTSTVTGPTTVSPLTTDANGCAIFGGLSGGSYTVAFTEPSGFIDVNGNTTVANQTQTVVPTSTAHVSVGPFAAPGGINASFSSSYKVSGTTYNVNAGTQASDQFTAVNQGMTPTNRAYGTDSTSSNNSYATSISSGNVLFPFSTSYSLYAGGCTGDAPPAAHQASATVTSNNTTNATIAEPAMLIYPWVTASPVDDPVGGGITYTGSWTHSTNQSGDYQSTLSTASATTASASYTFTGATSVTYYYATKSSYGNAMVAINGVAQPNIDEYSSSTITGNAATYTGLSSSGNTTITIKPAGTKDSASTGKTISVDELATNAIVLMTTTPDITVTDNNSGCASNKDYPPAQTPSPTQGALQFPASPMATTPSALTTACTTTRLRSRTPTTPTATSSMSTFTPAPAATRAAHARNATDTCEATAASR